MTSLRDIVHRELDTAMFENRYRLDTWTADAIAEDLARHSPALDDRDPEELVLAVKVVAAEEGGMKNPQLERTLERVLNGERPPATEGFFTTEPVQIIDLYKRREDLKRDLAAVEVAIERCHHDWVYTPDAAFEDRAGAWARVTYRSCRRCGIVNERIDATPGGPLGEWSRTAKFKVTA